jgi:hypothetical protein
MDTSTIDTALLANLAATAFGLTDFDISILTAAILLAMRSSMQNTYRRWNSTLGANNHMWMPTTEQEGQLSTAAQEHVSSIASTYADNLQNAIQQFLDAGDAPSLGAQLATWADARADWKSDQVAGYEVSYGTEQGTTAFIIDLLDGNLVDSLTGEVLDGADYAVGVVPDESSNDLCADYAGQQFPLDEAEDIPDFPMHPGCPHYKIIVPLTSPGGNDVSP